MSVSLPKLDKSELSELPVTIRNAGIAGAGGAGFPTYAKWERLDDVDSLLMNHQESEPNYFMDKWLGREHADEYAALFDSLLDTAFEKIVVGAKEKDRGKWLQQLEEATDGKVYEPADLPVAEDETGVVFAYTGDTYQFGMESVLLRMVGDVTIGNDLPMDYGWIVQNTETLHNLYRTLKDGAVVTHKYIHVDGDVPDHRFLQVPMGTPATALLEAAGTGADELADDAVLVDGGPGWCFEIEAPPAEFGVRKRSNAVMVLSRETVDEYTFGDDRINVIEERDWTDRDFETEPSETLDPRYVRVPTITNPAFRGLIQPSAPIVEPGDEVEEGEVVAVPADEGISNTQHASITGTVTGVTEDYVEIVQEGLDESVTPD